MPTSTIQVTIVDAAGVQKTFRAGRVDLDCGCGCIDIRPGKPAFYRDFESGVLALDDGTSVTVLNITHGMASLSGNDVHVLCEKAILESGARVEDPISPISLCNEGSASSTQAHPRGITLSSPAGPFPEELR